MHIATIINYCTHDYRHLKHCVQAVLPFSEQIIIPVATHFFDGKPETPLLLTQSFKNHPTCTFIYYHYDRKKPYGIRPFVDNPTDWSHYWHSTSRYIANHFLKPQIEDVLFLDVDEICDTKRFLAWYTAKDPQVVAFRPAAYFYFRKPTYQALTHPSYMLLAKKDSFTGEQILTPLERKGLFHSITGKKQEHTLGLDGLPLFHHYSWVAPEKELLRKVQSWGHHAEKNWETLLEEEFKHPFRYTEDLFSLNYQHVPPFCDPLSGSLPKKAAKGPFPNVISVEKETLLKMSMHHVESIA